MAVQDPTAAAKAAFPGQQFSTGDAITISGETYTYDGKAFMPGAAPGVAGTSSGETLSDTPPKWDETQDARKLPGAGKYPNYWAHKTRSGHVFMMDDSKGAESITIQHRGGSMLQISPDGKVHIRAQKGQHTVVFGENRMYVTGAYDITVDGAASMTVKKDMNFNAKNMNFTASGDMNIKATNLNLQPTGKLEIAGSAVTLKSNSHIGIEAHGAIGIVAKDGMEIASKEAEVVIVASKDIGIQSKNGKFIAQSATNMSLKSDQKISMRGEEKVSLASGNIVAIDGDVDVKVQQGASEPPDAQKTIQITKSTA